LGFSAAAWQCAPRDRFILKTAVEQLPANKNQHKLDKEN
jgi:hypothetical protein